MGWRDNLRTVSITIDGQPRTLIGASFRGVPFLVDASERSGGRRTVTHEFPFRDTSFTEDLGKKTINHRIEGYVLGSDYIAQRDALLDALEAEGPGQLLHPYFGALSAICTTNGTRQSKADGGIAFISFDFVETPAQAPAPTATVDGPATVSTAADAAIEATEAEFAEQYDAEGLPSFALESAELALTNAAEDLEAKLAPIITETQELAEFTGRIAVLTAEASSLVREPAEVLGAFRDVITGLVQTIAAAPAEVMNALFESYFVDLGATVVATTATRERELANQTAFTGALRRVIAVEAARLAPTVPYTSSDEALLVRDQIAEILEEQAGAADDTAYPALVDLRSQVLRAVPGSQALAKVVTVAQSVPVPSLVFTYQQYGSVDLELDVVARNGIRHPGFVSGELKVLSDGD